MSDKRDIPFGRPMISDADREAVMRVLHGHILTHGPECKAFESAFSTFLGPDAHSVTVSSCMAALHLASLHLGLGPGDEVILPAITHVAAAHAIEWVGATPVFVDPDPTTGNLTADRVKPAITAHTRAISLVHFVGIPCDMPPILELAAANQLHVIEDCAIALGSRWKGKHVGLFGDVGAFSFYPVKHITTGEGGMFVSRHAATAEAVAKLRAFGVDRTHAERTIPGLYEVPSLGLNYRMSEMQAALGRTQMAQLDGFLARRSANFAILKSTLADRTDLRILDECRPEATCSPYCLVAVLEGRLGERRNEVVTQLNGAGVGTSIYYPQPVPRMAYYRSKYGYDESHYPAACSIADRSIALPVGPHLDEGDMAYIGETFHRVSKEMLA